MHWCSHRATVGKGSPQGTVGASGREIFELLEQGLCAGQGYPDLSVGVWHGRAAWKQKAAGTSTTSSRSSSSGGGVVCMEGEVHLVP